MCPACISALAMMAAGAVSSGGLMAVVSKFRRMSVVKGSLESKNQKENTWEKQHTNK